MPHLLLAWELGAAYGHLAHLRELSQQFRSRGASCEFAVRDLDGAGRFLDSALGEVHQAPMALAPPLRPLAQQTSYASLLYQCGWADPVGLAARVRAWRSLIRRSGCTRLVADHAPTALLASHTLGLPAAAIGNGFTLPPVRKPFPPFNAAEPALLEANEAALLTLTNDALSRLALGPLPELQAIFEPVRPGLFTYPELDPYAPRAAADYLGLPRLATGDTVSWGERRQPRIFGYLRPFPGLATLIEALAALPAQVLLRVAEVPPAEFGRFARPGLVIVDHNVHLQQALQGSDVCISNAQHGTTLEMLLAGKPGLLLPDHRERELIAESARQLGAAIVMPALQATTIERYQQALRQLLDDPSWTANARAFADRHAGECREQSTMRWCDAVLEDA
jgi:UDP:flavonoid glycosyltransferase YjiC (YdhE family)